jgi:hypothetical protein
VTPRNKGRVETLTGCISHRLELAHLCKYCSAVLDDLKEEEDTGNWKHKHQMSFCGELALEEAMELS